MLYEANLRGAKLGKYILDEDELAEYKRRFHLEASPTEDVYSTSLVGATLIDSDLSAAQLTDVSLEETYLRNVTLLDTDMSEALLLNTTFANVDLSHVHGLDAVIHNGSSTLGIDSIYRSHGRLPENFLRGVGVPDALITWIYAHFPSK